LKAELFGSIVLQKRFALESWEAYFDWVQSRVRVWRPALDARYRAAMIERDGRIIAARGCASSGLGAPRGCDPTAEFDAR